MFVHETVTDFFTRDEKRNVKDYVIVHPVHIFLLKARTNDPQPTAIQRHCEFQPIFQLSLRLNLGQASNWRVDVVERMQRC